MGRAIDAGRAFSIRSREQPFGGRNGAQEAARRYPRSGQDTAATSPARDPAPAPPSAVHGPAAATLLCKGAA